MADTLSVGILEDDAFEIEKIAKIENKNKSTVLREIVGISLKEKFLELAINSFVKKEITIAKAAELADMPLTLFMDILSEKKISFHYSIKDIEEDFEGIYLQK